MLIVAAMIVHVKAGTVSSVVPRGASASVTITITGTGFSATASLNTATFTHAATATATTTSGISVATLDASRGIRRLSVRVPADAPVGTTALRITNTQTNEHTEAGSIEVLRLTMPAVKSGAVGTTQQIRLAGSPNVSFVPTNTRAGFGAGITVQSLVVESPTSLLANIVIAANASAGPRTVTVQTTNQTVSTESPFTVTPPNADPVISSVPATSATEGDPFTYEVQATDPDGDSLAYALRTAPAGMVVDAAGTIAWTPPAQSAGQADVLIEVSDGRGGVASQAFVISVARANQAPVISSQPPTTAVELSAYAYAVVMSDGDGDGITLAVEEAPAGMTLADNTVSWIPQSSQIGDHLVTLRATDARGAATTQSFTITVAGAALGIGVIAGRVLDDSTGLPLAGALAQLLEPAGIDAAVPPVASDVAGRFRIAKSPGPIRLRVWRDGYTRAERFVQVVDGKLVAPLDVRLTPLDTRQTAMSSVVGGAASNAAGTATLNLPAGAIDGDQSIRVTLASTQGAGGEVPLGWSTLGVIVAGAGTGAFHSPAQLVLQPPGGVTPGAAVVVARWDVESRAWIALGEASRGDDGKLQVLIPRFGEFAFVVADAAPDGPPAALVGVALQGVAARAPPAATVSISPSPRILFARPDARSTVGITVTPSAFLPSGTPVIVDVGESFSLTGGQLIERPHTPRTLALQNSAATLRAALQVSPSRQFAPFALRQGIIDLAARLPGDALAPRGSVVGPAGGLSALATGERLAIPSAATAEFVPVLLQRVSPSDVSLPPPSGFSILGGAVADLHGAVLIASASMAIPAPPELPADAFLVVAELVEAEDATRFALVAAVRRDGTMLVSTTDPVAGSVLPLPGVRRDGQYVFLRSDTSLGFVTGTISGLDGQPVAGALVDAGSGLVAITGEDGRYVLAGAPGDLSIRATHPLTKDTINTSARIETAQSVVSSSASVAATPPAVVSVTPQPGGTAVSRAAVVAIAFSEAIDPASITPATIRLLRGGVPVTGSLSLNPGNTTAVFRPGALLESSATYQLQVDAAVRDDAGHAMGAGFVSTFTTLDDTPPPLPPAGAIAATIPDNTGHSLVTGTQGTADPGGSVLVRNLRTNALTTLTPEANGGFSGVVAALRSDQLELTLVDASGNATAMPLPAFRNADGSVVVGMAGGRLEGAEGVAVDIPAGALPNGTVVRVSPVPANALPLPEPAEYPLVKAVRLELGGVRPLKELDLSIPAPPGALAQDQILVARPVTFLGAQRWTLVDRAALADARYTTASPPFPGIGGDATYAFLRTSGECVSYVSMRVQFNASAFLVPLVGPFVYPLFEFSQVVVPGACGSTLNIAVADANTGSFIQQISQTAPPAIDAIVDAGVLTDDVTAPVIAQINNPTGYQIATLDLRFSEPLDRASVCAHVVVRDSAGAAVAGQIDGCPATLGALPIAAAIFRPTLPFRLGERYSVSVEGVTDLAGNGVQAAPFTFTPFEPRSLALLRDEAELDQALKKCAGGACSSHGYDQAVIGNTLFIANGLRNAQEQYALAEPRRLLAVDITDPAHPKLIGWSATSTNPRALAAVRGAKVAGSARDLLLVAGGGTIAGGELNSKLEIYEVGTCTRRPAILPNCLAESVAPFKGAKLLSTPTGLPPRPGVPAESGVPLQIAALHQPGPLEDVLIAYVVTAPIGIAAIDVPRAFNAPFTDSTNFAPDALARGDYVDVAVLKNRLVAVGPLPGQTEQGVTILNAQLGLIRRLPPPAPGDLTQFPGAARVGVGANFVFDVDGDGNLGTAEDEDDDPASARSEVFDLALVGSGPLTSGCAVAPCGELYVIDASSVTDLAHPGAPAVLSRIPLPGAAFDVEVDPIARLAYVEVRGRGVVIVDLGHLLHVLAGTASGETSVDGNSDGVDDRVLRVIARTDIFATGLRIDLARGLAYVNGSSAGPQIVQITNACTELALDFRPKAPSKLITLDREKQTLINVLQGAVARLQQAGVGPVAMLEQGSGACFWRAEFPTSCTAFIAGTSDHDIEVFVPQVTVTAAQSILNDYVRSRPSGIELLGQLSLFAMPREAFEAAELLNGTPVYGQGVGDATGDLAMGRQLLLLLWLLEGEYVTGFDSGMAPLDTILARLKRKHLDDPVITGEPSGIPRLEGYEWALLQEFNVYKSGALLRARGSCADNNPVASEIETVDIEDVVHSFEDVDALYQDCQHQLHTVAKAAIRTVLARLAANTTTNPTVLDIERGSYRADGCLTGVQDPRNPPATVAGYTPKPCGGFEEYIVSIAVKSVRDGLGVFTAAELPAIFRYYCVKVGARCANREGQTIVGPLIASDQEANAFLDDALTFIEHAQGQTAIVYLQTAALDIEPIGSLPGLDQIAGICAAHGVAGLTFASPRSELRRCNRAIVGRKTNGDPSAIEPARKLGARNFVKRSFRVRASNFGARTVDVRIGMYDGPGDAAASYTLVRDYPVHRLAGGETRFIDSEPDPEEPGRLQPVFAQTFDLTELPPNQPRAIAFFIDPEGTIPEGNREDNGTAFYYYVLDRSQTSGPQGPADPAFPVDTLAPDPLCAAQPRIDLTFRAYGSSNTSLLGSREIVIEPGQSVELRYLIRNVGTGTVKNVRAFREGVPVDGSTVAELAPGSDHATVQHWTPPGSGTFLLRATARGEDADGNSLAAALDAVRITVKGATCDADVQSISPADPNPFDPDGVPLSVVMKGGSAFRYYRVVRNGLPWGDATVHTRIRRSTGAEQLVISTTDANGWLTHTTVDGDLDPRGLKILASDVGAPGETAEVTVEHVEGAAFTCPQRFAVTVSERTFSRSLKAGADLSVGGMLVGIAVGVKPGLGFEMKVDGDTAQERKKYSFGRTMTADVSAGLQGAKKSRVHVGDTQTLMAAEISGTVTANVALRDRHTFVPDASGALTSTQKAAVANLVAGLVAAAATSTVPISGPFLALILNELNEQLTGLDEFRESFGASLGMRTSVNAELSGPSLSFRKTGIPLLKDVGLTIGAEGSGAVSAAVSVDLLPLLSAAMLAGQYEQEFNLSAALSLALLGQEEDQKEVVLQATKTLQELLQVEGGASGRIKLNLVFGLDPIALQRVEIAISRKGNFGVKVVGTDVLDLGSGDLRTLTLRITDSSKFGLAVQSLLTLQGMNLAVNGVPSQIALSPTKLAEDIVQLFALFDEFEEVVEKKKGSEAAVGFDIKEVVAGGKLKLGVKVDSSLTTPIERGVVRGDRMYKLERYPAEDAALPAMFADGLLDVFNEVKEFADNITAEFKKVVTQGVIVEGVKTLFSLRQSPSGVDLLIDSSVEPADDVQIVGFKFQPVVGPVALTVGDPADVSGAPDRPHYGIGGFFQLAPDEKILAAPAELTILYEDFEVEGFDESSFRIYRWNGERQDWDLAGGVVDALNNTVKTSVTRLGVYTVAPPMPVGSIAFDGVATAPDVPARTNVSFTSAPVRLNSGGLVPDGTLFTVRTIVAGASVPIPLGTIFTADADPVTEGIQVASVGGVVQFDAELPGAAGTIAVLVNSTTGTAAGHTTLTYQRPQ